MVIGGLCAALGLASQLVGVIPLRDCAWRPVSRASDRLAVGHSL